MSRKRLSSEEREGLDPKALKLADAYFASKGDSPFLDVEVAAAVEAFLVGYSLHEVADRYPNLDRAKLCYTAAVQRWHHKRQEVASSIYDRVKAKLIRSVVEQVDFMTDMLSVASIESKETMAAYIKDPVNNPPPANRIRSLKDYKSAIDSLTQLTEHVSKIAGYRDSTVAEGRKQKQPKASAKESDILAVLAGSEDEAE